jgi:hypothetical protein
MSGHDGVAPSHEAAVAVSGATSIQDHEIARRAASLWVANRALGRRAFRGTPPAVKRASMMATGSWGTGSSGGASGSPPSAASARAIGLANGAARRRRRGQHGMDRAEQTARAER